MIDISNNKIHDEMAESVGKLMKNTKEIHFHGCGLTDKGIKQIVAQIVDQSFFV